MGGNSDKNKKYAYLSRLDTQTLETLLRADMDAPDGGDTDMVMYIMEVIGQREQDNSAEHQADTERAFQEFQERYNIPEGMGSFLYPYELSGEKAEESNLGETRLLANAAKPVRLHRWLRQGFAAIVAAAVLLGGLVCVQAAGIDVFGAIGRWTDETFHFETSPDGDNGQSQDVARELDEGELEHSFQTELKDCGIGEGLAPAWYPDGFETDGPEILRNDLGDTINCYFSNSDNEISYSIQIQRYNSASDMGMLNFEKDSASVEKYTSRQKIFYIFSNLGTTTATWSNGVSLVISIAGNIPTEDIKMIIDSIGG